MLSVGLALVTYGRRKIMIKYVIREVKNDALANNIQFDSMIEAIDYRTEGGIESETWIDEVKIRIDGKFKSTDRITKND